MKKDDDLLACTSQEVATIEVGNNTMLFALAQPRVACHSGQISEMSPKKEGLAEQEEGEKFQTQ